MKRMRILPVLGFALLLLGALPGTGQSREPTANKSDPIVSTVGERLPSRDVHLSYAREHNTVLDSAQYSLYASDGTASGLLAMTASFSLGVDIALHMPEIYRSPIQQVGYLLPCR